MTTEPNQDDAELREQINKSLEEVYRYGKGEYNTNPPLAEERRLMAVIKARDAAIRYSAEVWLPYNVYPFNGEYEISSAGRVRRNGKLLAQSNLSSDENTYKVVNLSIDNVRKNYSVHRLVAQTFIVNHEGKRTVNHKNGKKSDNSVNNLEWATYQENERHAFDVLGKQSGKKGKFNETCYKGHPYSGENLHIYPDGRRACKECRRVYQQERRAELRRESDLVRHKQDLWLSCPHCGAECKAGETMKHKVGCIDWGMF